MPSMFAGCLAGCIGSIDRPTGKSVTLDLSEEVFWLERGEDIVVEGTITLCAEGFCDFPLTAEMKFRSTTQLPVELLEFPPPVVGMVSGDRCQLTLPPGTECGRLKAVHYRTRVSAIQRPFSIGFESESEKFCSLVLQSLYAPKEQATNISVKIACEADDGIRPQPDRGDVEAAPGGYTWELGALDGQQRTALELGQRPPPTEVQVDFFMRSSNIASLSLESFHVRERECQQDVQLAVESFCKENGVDAGSTKTLLAQPVLVQKRVLNAGGVKTARNPSKLLRQRIETCGGHQDIDLAIENYCKENGVNWESVETLLLQPLHVQKRVLNAGSVKAARHPSKLLMQRIKSCGGQQECKHLVRSCVRGSGALRTGPPQLRQRRIVLSERTPGQNQQKGLRIAAALVRGTGGKIGMQMTVGNFSAEPMTAWGMRFNKNPFGLVPDETLNPLLGELAGGGMSCATMRVVANEAAYCSASFDTPLSLQVAVKTKIGTAPPEVFVFSVSYDLQAVLVDGWPMTEEQFWTQWRELPIGVTIGGRLSLSRSPRSICADQIKARCWQYFMYVVRHQQDSVSDTLLISASTVNNLHICCQVTLQPATSAISLQIRCDLAGLLSSFQDYVSEVLQITLQPCEA